MSDARTILVRYEDLVALLTSIFKNAGVGAANSAILAENCASCERDGSLSHGLFRVPGYVSSLACGWVDGAAVPMIEDASLSFVRVDARNGFAQPALALAREHVLAKVRASGAAVIAIRDSHHFSALWPDVEPFAREGLVALSVVSNMACVVPLGGRKAVLGTNPIAFATPVAGADPFVFDQATSAMSHGDVQIAARTGVQLEEGCAVDSEGRATTDARAALEGGALKTFGGYKGALISLMVEVLASALTGGNFSFEVNWSSHPGAQTPKTGQLLILIDPSRGGHNFSGRVLELLDAVRDAGQTRLPGQRRYERRKLCLMEGVPVPEAQLTALTALA